MKRRKWHGASVRMGREGGEAATAVHSPAARAAASQASLGRRHANSNSAQSVTDAAQPSKAAPLNLTEERLPEWAMTLSKQPRYGARRRSEI